LQIKSAIKSYYQLSFSCCIYFFFAGSKQATFRKEFRKGIAKEECGSMIEIVQLPLAVISRTASGIPDLGVSPQSNTFFFLGGLEKPRSYADH